MWRYERVYERTQEGGGKKMEIENLKGFEFECEKCGCVVRTGLDRETILGFCPNCETGFGYNDMNDPIVHILRAVKAAREVRKVKIRLICEEAGDE